MKSKNVVKPLDAREGRGAQIAVRIRPSTLELLNKAIVSTGMLQTEVVERCIREFAPELEKRVARAKKLGLI